MNKEEIENRIIICEQKVRDYLEVGNTKTAERYNNEIHKWEKILSDLELLYAREIKELLDYKKGYFCLEQENKKYKEVIDKLKNILNNQMNYREFVDIVNAIEDIVKEVE